MVKPASKLEANTAYQADASAAFSRGINRANSKSEGATDEPRRSERKDADELGERGFCYTDLVEP